MTGILDEIIANKKAEVAIAKVRRPLETSGRLRQVSPFRFRHALKKGTTPVSPSRLIAEIKPRSPSNPDLAPQLDLEATISKYNRFASAISVLTDRKFFGGDMELLARVKELSSLPVLRKDFVIDPYQILEAASAGADAVLLIARILSRELLLDLSELALEMGMDPVIEIQNESELTMASQTRAEIILINNRCLDTLAIDLNTTKRLRPAVPRGITVVSASGIKSASDIAQLLPFTSNFLVGTSLMESRCLEDKLAELACAVSI